MRSRWCFSLNDPFTSRWHEADVLERLRQILIKEFIHLFRDRHARFSLIVPPLVQMLIFGYAASYEVNRVSTAVLDNDHSQESREFLERFSASSRFEVTNVLHSESQIPSMIEHRRDLGLAL